MLEILVTMVFLYAAYRVGAFVGRWWWRNALASVKTSSAELDRTPAGERKEGARNGKLAA